MAKKAKARPGRDVGKMGEGVFHTWCGEADLIHNQAGDDKGGWDYLVQFKPPDALGPEVRSLDQLPTSPACWVQVKATDKGTNPDIKLTNWKRMVDYPTPVFILLLDFGGKAAPRNAWFIHVDQDLVTQVLERLRRVPLARADQLHKLAMAVSPRVTDLMASPSGLEMRDRIEAALGPDAGKYFSQKQSWKERAGERRLRVHLSFPPEGDSVDGLHDRLVDFALGLSEEMPSTLVRLEEVRFGIPVQVSPTDVPQKVTVRMPERPHARGKIEFATEDGLERSSLPCSIYHPGSMFPFIPKERLRYRVAMKDLDLVFKEAGGANIRGYPGFQVERTIADWAASMRVLKMLQGDAPLTYCIDAGARLQGTIGADGRTMTMSPEARTMMESAINAFTLLSRLDLDPGAYRSDGYHLIAGASFLEEAVRIVATDRMSIVISGDVGDDIPEGLLAGYPLVAAAPVGSDVIVAGIAVHGQVRLERDPSIPMNPGPGREQFVVRNPEVTRVFVKVVPLPEGGTVSLYPYVDEVVAWIEGKELGLIPSAQMRPEGGPSSST